MFEMGMNHAGEIGPLAQLVRPHIAIITGIAPVHLEYFKSLDGIADAKAEIFEGVEPGGAAVLNRDSEHFERLAKKAEAREDRTIVVVRRARDSRRAADPMRAAAVRLHRACAAFSAPT